VAEVGDPYLDGTHEYWSLSRPSPELASAVADKWLLPPGKVLDLGCGLATEASYLAGLGFAAWGLDRSPVALRQARALHPTVRLVRADARALPFPDECFDVLLDRGTLHYLNARDRDTYAKEASRVLRPGGRFLLRACLYTAGNRNDVDKTAVLRAFFGWRVDRLTQEELISDTRTMPALVFRLRNGRAI
jgi:ubiquinone/menaquinone biosynthesis C-methylase UbiE